MPVALYLRLSREFWTCLLFFFYEKIPATQKHVTSKNQLTKKGKQKLNSKGNKFSHAQKLLGV